MEETNSIYRIHREVDVDDLTINDVSVAMRTPDYYISIRSDRYFKELRKLLVIHNDESDIDISVEMLDDVPVVKELFNNLIKNCTVDPRDFTINDNTIVHDQTGKTATFGNFVFTYIDNDEIIEISSLDIPEKAMMLLDNCGLAH